MSGQEQERKWKAAVEASIASYRNVVTIQKIFSAAPRSAALYDNREQLFLSTGTLSKEAAILNVTSPYLFGDLAQRLSRYANSDSTIEAKYKKGRKVLRQVHRDALAVCMYKIMEDTKVKFADVKAEGLFTQNFISHRIIKVMKKLFGYTITVAEEGGGSFEVIDEKVTDAWIEALKAYMDGNLSFKHINKILNDKEKKITFYARNGWSITLMNSVYNVMHAELLRYTMFLKAPVSEYNEPNDFIKYGLMDAHVFMQQFHGTQHFANIDWIKQTLNDVIKHEFHEQYRTSQIALPLGMLFAKGLYPERADAFYSLLLQQTLMVQKIAEILKTEIFSGPGLWAAIKAPTVAMLAVGASIVTARVAYSTAASVTTTQRQNPGGVFQNVLGAWANVVGHNMQTKFMGSIGKAGILDRMDNLFLRVPHLGGKALAHATTKSVGLVLQQYGIPYHWDNLNIASNAATIFFSTSGGIQETFVDTIKSSVIKLTGEAASAVAVGHSAVETYKYLQPKETHKRNEKISEVFWYFASTGDSSFIRNYKIRLGFAIPIKSIARFGIRTFNTYKLLTALILNKPISADMVYGANAGFEDSAPGEEKDPNDVKSPSELPAPPSGNSDSFLPNAPPRMQLLPDPHNTNQPENAMSVVTYQGPEATGETKAPKKRGSVLPPPSDLPGLSNVAENISSSFVLPPKDAMQAPPNHEKRIIIMKSSALLDAWGQSIGVFKLRYDFNDSVERLLSEFNEIKQKILQWEKFKQMSNVSHVENRTSGVEFVRHGGLHEDARPHTAQMLAEHTDVSNLQSHGRMSGHKRGPVVPPPAAVSVSRPDGNKRPRVRGEGTQEYFFNSVGREPDVSVRMNRQSINYPSNQAFYKRGGSFY